MFVKYGASARASSTVKDSVAARGSGTVVGYSTSHADERLRVSPSPVRTISRLRCDGAREPRRLLHVPRAVPADVLARADRHAVAAHARDHRARRMRLSRAGALRRRAVDRLE